MYIRWSSAESKQKFELALSPLSTMDSPSTIDPESEAVSAYTHSSKLHEAEIEIKTDLDPERKN